MTNRLAEMKSYLGTLAGLHWSHKPESFTYAGAEDYVLERGRPFDSSTPLTRDELRLVEEVADSACWAHCAFATKECFTNAQQLILNDDSGTLVYCEGFAIGGASFAVHHAWVSINGKVVDLTWRKETVFLQGTWEVEDLDHGTWENRVLGEAPEGWLYFGCDDLVESADMLRMRLLRYEAWLPYLAADVHVQDISERFKQPRVGTPPEDMAAAFAALRKLSEDA